SSPAAARARQAAAKLGAVPRLLAAARANMRRPPRPFVERAIVMFRGAAALFDRELALAFADVDTRLKSELMAGAAEARRGLEQYAAELESTVPPQAQDAFAIGTAAVEARYRAEELIDTPAPELLAIGERELKRTRQEFSDTAAKVDARRTPIEVWRDVLRDHPRRGELVGAAQQTVHDLFAFIREHRLIDVPSAERVVVAAAP